jgi:hypothetical protein
MDSDTNNIIIKKVSKEEAESIDKESLTKISLKSSYGRITGKKMIDQISFILGLDFKTQNAYKYNAKWNTGTKMLIIETGGKKNA